MGVFDWLKKSLLTAAVPGYGLYQAFKKAQPQARRVKRFVQKYPTPAKFVRPQIQQRVVQPIKQYVQPKPQVRLIDILRETPQAISRTIGPKAVQRGFVQPLARGVGSVYHTLAGEKGFKPETKIEKEVFGEKYLGGEPIKTVPLEKYFTQETGIKLKPESKWAYPLGIGMATMDISPFGMGKGGAVKQIAKTKNVGKIAQLIKGMGKISDDAIPVVAKKLENVTDIKKISKSLDKAAEVIPYKKLKIATGGKLAQQEKNIRVKVKYISDIDPQSVKDITGFDASFKSVYRNMSKAFGRGFGKVKRRILDPFDASKGAMVDEQVRQIDSFKRNIIDKYNIQKGSKESALIQRWGEKRITLEELKQVTPKWKQVVESDKWLRTQYDNMLNELNAIRKQIYPNRSDKLISKRQDYYRHFQEMEGLEGMKNLYEGPSNIPTELAGISDYTEPKARFLSLAQRRLGGGFKEDAVGGFLDYIRAATYSKHIDPHISKFRNMAGELRGMAVDDPKQASRLTEYITDFANDLAGKTNPIDRSIQKVTGRKFFRAIDWINRRTKMNVILGNISSAVAQAGNVPQIMSHSGYGKFAKGFADTVMGIGRRDKVILKSNFIKERYAFDIFGKFDKGILANTRRFAAWITKALDEVSTKAGWNAFYRQGKAINTPDPIKYADDLIREMVAGRGIGEVPLAQKSKVVQILAPFQVEVQNLWHVLGKTMGERKFGTLLKFAVAAYGFNNVTQRIRGSGVTFDPIKAVGDAYLAYQEEEDKKIGGIRVGGRLIGEVLSNIVGGQTLAALYPEYGYKIPGTDETITRKELFGEEDPTRFGSGLLAAGGIREPLYKLVPPFGGQQVKRTIQGLKTVGKGYAETAKDKVQTPVEQDFINYIKGGLMGKQSLKEMQKYYKEKTRPLSEKQTEIFKTISDKKDYYTSIMTKRQKDKEIEKLKGDQGGTLSDGTTIKKIGNEWKTFDTPEEAEVAIIEDNFKKSGKQEQIIGDTYYYLTEGGNVSSKPKLDHNIDMSNDRLTQYYRTKNFDSYMPEAEKLMKLYERKYQTEMTGEDRLELENKILQLAGWMEKYGSYGGFKKGRKGRKGRKAKKPKQPKGVSIKVATGTTSIKAPKKAKGAKEKLISLRMRAAPRRRKIKKLRVKRMI